LPGCGALPQATPSKQGLLLRPNTTSGASRWYLGLSWSSGPPLLGEVLDGSSLDHVPEINVSI